MILIQLKVDSRAQTVFGGALINRGDINCRLAPAPKASSASHLSFSQQRVTATCQFCDMEENHPRQPILSHACPMYVK
jgi:hypothetical protein